MNITIFLLIGLELLIVSWWDLKQKRISNWWPIINMFIGVGLYLLLPLEYVFSWEIFIFPVGFILIGFVFFLLKIMGAGDSKFLASLFLLVPVEFHLMLLEKLVHATVAVGAILLIGNMLRDPAKLRAFLLSGYWQGLRNIIKSHFSYAPVIGLAWILFGARLWF